MMKIFWRIAPLIFLGAILFSCNIQERRIEKCVEAELALHPESELKDLYKYFFQDVFGPGHLAPDSNSAARYLDYELANAKRFERPKYQKLEYRKQFVRVNLSVVADSEISKKQFLILFLQSASNYSVPKTDDWRKEWAEILKVIKNMDIKLNSFPEDQQFIDSVLRSGDYVIHHSQKYIDEYDPHYRIFHSNELKSLKLSNR